MNEALPLQTMSVEEYLRYDESSEVRHEYVRGELYEMPAATVRHARIVGNVGVRVFGAVKGPCDVLVSAMRLEVAHDVYYYPDVMVACAPMDDLDVIVREPCVVVEVTSPESARIDRVEKLDAYRRITGLRAYLIVDHRRRRVERYWRAALGSEWRREEIVAEGSIVVPCLDVELTLDEIYRRVELPAVGEPDPVEYET